MSMNRDNEHDGIKVDFLQSVVHIYQSIHPTIARYHSHRLFNLGDISCKQTNCRFCGSQFTCTNSRVRFKPKVKLTNRMRRLLLRDYNTLGSYHKLLVQRYKMSTSVKQVKCFNCQKKNTFCVLGSTQRVTDKISERKLKTARENGLRSQRNSEGTSSVETVPIPLTLDRLEQKYTKRSPGKSKRIFESSDDKNNILISRESKVYKKWGYLKEVPSSQGTQNRNRNVRKRSKSLHSQLAALVAEEEGSNKSATLQDFLTGV